MKVDRFRGPNAAAAMAVAKLAMGDDVLLIDTRDWREGGMRGKEVLVARAADHDALMQRLDPPVPERALPGARRKGERPYVIALVGPPGAGKTTTAVKLAVHPQVFAQVTTGFLTLDTFRAGAVEQLKVYALVTDLPLQTVYTPADVEGAMAALTAAGCDVVIVDTPGRSPLSTEQNAQWRELLEAIRPDEVHLVLPASVRPDVARLHAQVFMDHGTTHMIVSKLDELPSGAGIIDLVAELDLRARWVANGQEVPYDLRPAQTGLPAALSAIGH